MRLALLPPAFPCMRAGRLQSCLPGPVAVEPCGASLNRRYSAFPGTAAMLSTRRLPVSRHIPANADAEAANDTHAHPKAGARHMTGAVEGTSGLPPAGCGWTRVWSRLPSQSRYPHIRMPTGPGQAGNGTDRPVVGRVVPPASPLVKAAGRRGLGGNVPRGP